MRRHQDPEELAQVARTCTLHTCYCLCVEVPCDRDVLPSQDCKYSITMKKAFTISQEMYKAYIPGIKKGTPALDVAWQPHNSPGHERKEWGCRIESQDDANRSSQKSHTRQPGLQRLHDAEGDQGHQPEAVLMPGEARKVGHRNLVGNML